MAYATSLWVGLILEFKNILYYPLAGEGLSILLSPKIDDLTRLTRPKRPLDAPS